MPEMVSRWTIDQVCDLLRSESRRRVLECLAHEETQEVKEIARSIQHDGSSKSIEQTVVILNHHHLPKLTEAGAVTFDQDEGTVTLTDEGELLLRRRDDMK